MPGWPHHSLNAVARKPVGLHEPTKLTGLQHHLFTALFAKKGPQLFSGRGKRRGAGWQRLKEHITHSNVPTGQVKYMTWHHICQETLWNSMAIFTSFFFFSSVFLYISIFTARRIIRHKITTFNALLPTVSSQPFENPGTIPVQQFTFLPSLETD